MKKIVLFLFALLLTIPSILAENPTSHSELKLIPQPKEVQPHQGSFRIRATTKILVEFGHQAEDRIAAETLAEEIHDQSGLNLRITGSKEKGKHPGSTIELARLQDLSVKKFLQLRGLRSDSIGDQGYRARLVLRRANLAATSAPGRREAGMSCSLHPRLAEHGVARRAG
jgi:hypothetical protein